VGGKLSSPGEAGPAAGAYGCAVIVEQHWWNGSKTLRMRRDVYIRSDGPRWDVLVQIGGASGRYQVQECPSGSSAAIVAGAWRGSGADWRLVPPPVVDALRVGSAHSR